MREGNDLPTKEVKLNCRQVQRAGGWMEMKRNLSRR